MRFLSSQCHYSRIAWRSDDTAFFGGIDAFRPSEYPPRSSKKSPSSLRPTSLQSGSLSVAGPPRAAVPTVVASSESSFSTWCEFTVRYFLLLRFRPVFARGSADGAADARRTRTSAAVVFSDFHARSATGLNVPSVTPGLWPVESTRFACSLSLIHI